MRLESTAHLQHTSFPGQSQPVVKSLSPILLWDNDPGPLHFLLQSECPSWNAEQRFYAGPA